LPAQSVVFSSSEDEDEGGLEPPSKASISSTRKAPISMKFLDQEISDSSVEGEESSDEIVGDATAIKRHKRISKKLPPKATPDSNSTDKPNMKKKSKKDLELQVQNDEKISQFVQKMLNAAEEDYAAIESHSAATKKYQLLPIVLKYLSRQDYHESLLEQGVCTAIRYWLEPYSDHSLPGLDIRKGLLEALSSLPIDMYHLKDSGLGRAIKALSKSPNETKENKKLCQSLIYNWSSSVLGKDMDYRSLSAIRWHSSSNRLEESDDEGEIEDSAYEYNIEHPTISNSKTPAKSAPIVPTAKHVSSYSQPRGAFTAPTAITAANTPEKYKILFGQMQKLKSGKTRTTKF
jgi:TFIIS helical bundle-like domain